MTSQACELMSCVNCGEKWKGIDLITPLPNVYVGEYPLRDGETSPERMAFRLEEGLPVDSEDPLGLERVGTLKTLLGGEFDRSCCPSSRSAQSLLQLRRVQAIALPPQEVHRAQGLVDRLSTVPYYDPDMSPSTAYANCLLRQLGVLVSGLEPEESITLDAPPLFHS